MAISPRLATRTLSKGKGTLGSPEGAVLWSGRLTSCDSGGHRLVSEGFDPSRLRDLLKGRRFGNSIEVVESTGSTNLDVTSMARAGPPDRLVLIPEHQSAGRGR